MAKRWSKTEIAHLERHAAEQTVEDLAQRLQTDERTVRTKLEELGITALGEATAPLGTQEDGSLESYSEGVRQLSEGNWSAAAELFERVLAESDHRQISDRARQNLAICRQHAATEAASDDPYLQAIYAKNRGQLEAALEICLAQDLEDERWSYLRASLEALSGQPDEALEHLASAIRLEPKNRIHAYHDPDFAGIRDQESFRSLIFEPEPGS